MLILFFKQRLLLVKYSISQRDRSALYYMHIDMDRLEMIIFSYLNIQLIQLFVLSTDKTQKKSANSVRILDIFS